MDKIGAYTNTADGNDEFTEGDPSTGTPATEVDGGWLNGVQRELLEVMTQMGLTPSDADDTLVWQALQAVYGKTFAGDPNSNVAANVLRERCWDTSTSPPTLYVATVADGTPGGSTWTRFTDLLRAASTTVKGVVELATNTETQAGTDAQRAVTPAGLASALGVTGALVPLAQAAAADDAAIEFTSNIDSTYDEYVVIVSGFRPATDGAQLFMRVSTDGGSNWDAGATDYSWVVDGRRSDGTTLDDNSNGDTSIRKIIASTGSSAGESGRLVLHIDGMPTVRLTNITALATSFDSGSRTNVQETAGSRRTGQVENAIQFIASSGNIASGTFRLYGVKKS